VVDLAFHGPLGEPITAGLPDGIGGKSSAGGGGQSGSGRHPARSDSENPPQVNRASSDALDERLPQAPVSTREERSQRRSKAIIGIYANPVAIIEMTRQRLSQLKRNRFLVRQNTHARSLHSLKMLTMIESDERHGYYRTASRLASRLAVRRSLDVDTIGLVSASP
jgi:hypothetical protein